MSLAVVKYENKNPHRPLPSPSQTSNVVRVFHFDFELNANEAKVDGNNAVADEASEADADETKDVGNKVA